MKKLTLLVICLMTVAFCGSSFADARSEYQAAKDQYKAKGDYVSNWHYAKAAYRYAEYVVTDNDKRKLILTDAKDAAHKATEQSPQRPEAHYWLGVCYGAWAEANGVLNSLQYAKPIAEQMTMAITIDPSLFHGAAFAVRGRVYHKAPGWPISVGDSIKADADLKRAIQYGPNNRKAYRFYAEFLVGAARKKEATEIIDKGLALAYDKADGLVEDREIALLKELKGKTAK